MSTIRVRRLDANHDMVFGRGKADYLTDLDAVVQILQTRLLLFKGEWWEDLNEGIPMWQSILGQSGAKRSLQAIERLVQKHILDTPYVISIYDVVSSYDRAIRSYSYQASVVTEFGTVIVTNVPTA